MSKNVAYDFGQGEQENFMGRKMNVDMLPKEYKEKVISFLVEKRLTLEEIANWVNTEVGKQVVSRMSIQRFALLHHKENADTNSLERIATALEKIADSLEPPPKMQG